ncbi:MAG: PTS transporter subunit EIIC [Solobacterium sp.]|jgi:PTS system beta-glucosides-specific IIC component|nr:PTS transporter subunit EIIC [Solobacterium sp.]
MAKKNYEEMSQAILENVGGSGNISSAFHCITRLRFKLKDKSIADLDALKAIDGVVGTQWSGDQLQIIIGQDVGEVYTALCRIGGLKEEKSIDENLDTGTKKKFKFTVIFEVMAAILLPVVPALAGGGMIKGLVTIMTSYLGFDSASALIQVLTIAGDCAFYFLPFLVAWSASKRFKTDTAMSIAMAAVLLYPTMTAGNTSGAAALSLFGLPIPFPRYFGSTIPIILTVLVLSYVYRWVNSWMPKVLRIVFTPTVVLLIMTPLTLIAIGPLASYAAKGLVYVVKFLYDLSPLVAGAIVGATRLFVVMTGMHLSLGAICMENLATFGYDYLLPMNTMGTLALFGACLAVWIRGKKEETKSIGASTAISAFIGITEPGIYGVFLKYRSAMIAAIAGGAAGGAIVGLFGGRALAYVNSCILSLPVFMTDGFWSVCLGMAVSAGVAFAIVMIMGVKEDNEKAAN